MKKEVCKAPNGAIYEKYTVPKRDNIGARALIYAPNADIGRIQKDMLRSSGMRNVTSSAKISEITSLHATAPSSFILINEDADLDPKDVIDVLRNSDTSSDTFVPVIFASFVCSEAVVRRCIGIGYDTVLSIPFSKIRLCKTIEKLTQHERTFVKTQTYFGPDRRQGLLGKSKSDERRGSKLSPMVKKAG
jgi:DNA-binding response OmpR family regulator